MKFCLCLFVSLFYFQLVSKAVEALPEGIKHDPVAKVITLISPDRKLSLVIDYAQGCVLKRLDLNGQSTLAPSGAYTGFRMQNKSFSSVNPLNEVRVTEQTDGITISNIRFGDADLSIDETWNFRLERHNILWEITRTYDRDSYVEELALPKWNFAALSTWKGGIFDNGGMVWCKYLKQLHDTYGVHTGGVTFWNEQSPDALRIQAHADQGGELAAKYSHGEGGTFVVSQSLSDASPKQRYDLSRFVSQKADVFAPVEVKKGVIKIALALQYIDYKQEYTRGVLPGIDAAAVQELLNTTGRYGVVDNHIVGANGWLTNWKCLHEPFFAQIGMALNDSNYVKNMSATLDQERDLAMLPDGRVLSRWHNAPGDEIPGTYNRETGYYEAMWGYTIDSQTGYVINTGEQFALNGDLAWLRSHQMSCEKALDWLINRDSNRNGIFEMMNKGVAEQTASDWLDIVWASFENAFVNAQLYEALVLWSDCERVLGKLEKADYYAGVAQKLKEAFNKPVEEGGFWLPAKKQYVYWRDNDGTVHGDNLVTPVNFAAIAFGICDDPERIALILDQIEKRSMAEKLFHWPLCFDSFKKEEVSDRNWPFPTYENGDIFPTWGYLGVRAYVKYDKDLALKYVRNILEQYKKDGLSSQRYSRTTQLGLGDDILAGICTSVTALYRDIYGIRPKWNRMGLEPNMIASLNGTTFPYTLRGTTYQIELQVDNYRLSTADFSVSGKESFGAAKNGNTLRFYPHNQEDMTLDLEALRGQAIDLVAGPWQEGSFSWHITSPGEYQLTLKGLAEDASYELWIDDQVEPVRLTEGGRLSFRQVCKSETRFVLKRSA